MWMNIDRVWHPTVARERDVFDSDRSNGNSVKPNRLYFTRAFSAPDSHRTTAEYYYFNCTRTKRENVTLTARQLCGTVYTAIYRVSLLKPR
jgi:hypothetical protein